MVEEAKETVEDGEEMDSNGGGREVEGERRENRRNEGGGEEREGLRSRLPTRRPPPTMRTL